MAIILVKNSWQFGVVPETDLVVLDDQVGRFSVTQIYSQTTSIGQDSEPQFISCPYPLVVNPLIPIPKGYLGQQSFNNPAQLLKVKVDPVTPASNDTGTDDRPVFGFLKVGFSAGNFDPRRICTTLSNAFVLFAYPQRGPLARKRVCLKHNIARVAEQNFGALQMPEIKNVTDDKVPVEVDIEQLSAEDRRTCPSGCSL